MAKYKGSSKRPQPKHKKSKPSQHDKSKRLQSRNPRRKKTTKAKVPLVGAVQKAVSALQAVMDRRIAFRMAIVVAGMLLADDRRTASAWFVAAGVQDDWDRFYDCLASVGRTSGKLATAVLGLIVLGMLVGMLSRRRTGGGTAEVTGPAALTAGEGAMAAAGGSRNPGLEQQIESKLAEHEALQQKMDAQALNSLKLSPVITKKAEVFAKHLREKIKTEPEVSAQILHTWIREEEN